MSAERQSLRRIGADMTKGQVTIGSRRTIVSSAADVWATEGFPERSYATMHLRASLGCDRAKRKVA